MIERAMDPADKQQRQGLYKITYIGYTIEGNENSMNVKVVMDGKRCERCGHVWVPRIKRPVIRICPRCKSPYWDTPRKASKAK